MEVSGQIHRPATFTPRERAPNSHFIGGWVAPRASMDVVVRRKIPKKLNTKLKSVTKCQMHGTWNVLSLNILLQMQ